MRNKTIFLIIGLIALAVVLVQTFFVVFQTQQAIVLQFGEPKKVIREPGLAWKIPFIQSVQYYDRRILDLDPPQFEVLLTDKKRINVDAFARYRIIDPLLYFQRVTTDRVAKDRLGKLINPALRAVIAKTSLKDLLSQKRAQFMEQIQNQVEGDASRLGMKIVDIRIGRTDLPQQTSDSVFDRMRKEREREAREARAEGKEIAQKVRAGADKERTIILANAEREAQILRGQGEAGRNRLLGEAYGADPEFFAFYKSLEQYLKALGGKNTTMILSPDNDFFKYFNNMSGESKK